MKFINGRLGLPLLLLICSVCLVGCNSSLLPIESGTAVSESTSRASDPGVQEFLARSGFLGSASITDRAIGAERYLVYHSASDLRPEDVNGKDDIYLRDLRTGSEELVSVSTGGALGNGDSTQASISANGRFVVFRSAATNLVAGDTNGAEDIFLRDLLSKTTSRVSLTQGGGESDGTSLTPAVSDDGRYVVFASSATNLVATDGNGAQDIFLRDRTSNTTTLVSSNSVLPTSANGSSHDPAITPDGAFIAFSTEATDIIAGGLNGQRQVLRVDRANPTTRVLVSQNSGAQANGPCYEPSLSNDGNLVAFFTSADNLGTDTNSLFDVYIRNHSGNSIARASVNSVGGETDGHSGFPSISADGSVVSFGSLATNVVSGDSNGAFDVFSRSAGVNTRVSVATGGAEANIDSDLPAISLSGRYVAFRSAATTLSPADTIADDDIYVRDLASSTTTFASSVCKGQASFTGFTSSTISGVTSPEGIALGDVDADGDLDLVNSEFSANRRVVLRFNDGSGGFSAPTNLGVSKSTSDVTFGDLNNDGNLDIVATGYDTFANGEVYMRFGDGAGGFASELRRTVDAGPISVVLGDITNDGILDILTPSQFTSNGVSVLRGSSSGFYFREPGVAAGTGPIESALGDVNEDGNLDVIVAHGGGGAFVNLGDGTGEFSATTYPSRNNSVALGDIDGDGHLDVAGTDQASSRVSYTRGDGNGVFDGGLIDAGGAYTELNQPRAMALGDLNGDGRLDMTYLNSSGNNLSIRLNTGVKGFDTFRQSSSQVVGDVPVESALGDLDGDGNLDIAVTNINSDSITILLNNRPDWAGLAAAMTTATGTAPGAVARGDIDGDGDLDLVTANFGSNNVSLLLNNGSGVFTVAGAVTVGAGPVSVKLGDLDGDGDLDLVSANATGSSLSTSLNNGVGSFGVATTIALGSAPSALAVGDVDSDGDLDVSTANESADSASIFLNDGNGLLGLASQLPMGDGPVDVVLADADGDGDLDLSTADFIDDTVSLRLNNGAGTFAAATTLATLAGPRAVGFVDLNKDRRPDLVSVNETDDSVMVRLNTGGVSFPQFTRIPVGDAPSSLGFEDFDGDGDLDVFAINANGNSVSVLSNTNLGTLISVLTPSVGTQPRALATGDFDGDGDLDIATANQTSGDVTVRLNQLCP